MRLVAQIAAHAIIVFARLITAVRGICQDTERATRQCVYFANHASHGDFILIWTVLPPRLRGRTRPVAGADYWLASPLRRFIGCGVFNAVLIERERDQRQQDPIEAMAEALDQGASLIVFPEGTRNQSEAPLLPLRSGLYRLAKARPDIDLVPVWISNLNRVMPKGEFIPIPLICSVTFAAPMRLIDGEDRDAFMERARTALLLLSTGSEGTAS